MMDDIQIKQLQDYAEELARKNYGSGFEVKIDEVDEELSSMGEYKIGVYDNRGEIKEFCLVKDGEVFVPKSSKLSVTEGEVIDGLGIYLRNIQTE